MPMSMGVIRTGVDERREAAEAAARAEALERGELIEEDALVAAMNEALTTATLAGPEAGLAVLKPLEKALDGDFRLHAIRAHLLEMEGRDVDGAILDYRIAADGTTSFPEERYLRGRLEQLEGLDPEAA
jgi:predicted RNA polymerase sigma factor